VVIFEAKHLLEKICAFEKQARSGAKKIAKIDSARREESVENIDRIFRDVRRFVTALNHTELFVRPSHIEIRCPAPPLSDSFGYSDVSRHSTTSGYSDVSRRVTTIV